MCETKNRKFANGEENSDEEVRRKETGRYESDEGYEGYEREEVIVTCTAPPFLLQVCPVCIIFVSVHRRSKVLTLYSPASFPSKPLVLSLMFFMCGRSFHPTSSGFFPTTRSDCREMTLESFCA